MNRPSLPFMPGEEVRASAGLPSALVLELERNKRTLDESVQRLKRKNGEFEAKLRAKGWL